MKKHIFAFIFILTTSVALSSTTAYGITTTPTSNPKPTKITPSPTKSSKSSTDALNDQISNLKERIASRVAELRLVEKRGLVGTIAERSDTQLTITDLNGKTRFVDVDDITKFSSPSSKESFGISDLTKGTKISVLGLYNRQSQRVLARFIVVVILPTYLNGTITSVNDDDFTAKIVTEDSRETTIDIENVTKTSTYTKSDGKVKAGFSKIKTGDRAMIVGFPDKKVANRIVASRVLLFPDFPKNPKITAAENILNEGDETVPSTGSGKKLTPIR